jgi:pre-mRNA-splicing factor 18
MDFKSLMAAQIAKSKPAKAAPSAAAPASTATTDAANKKYLRRAELEAAREAEYAAEQARIEAERVERQAKKRKLEEEEAEREAVREEKRRRLAEESKRRREEEEREEERKRRKRLGLPELAETETETAVDGDGNVAQDIPDDELRNKLRDLDQPAALFDETHAWRLRRYYRLTKKHEVVRYHDGPIPTTLEPVEEKDLLLQPPEKKTKSADERNFLYRQLASYFNLLLKEWSVALSRRDATVKASQSGKAAQHSYLAVLKDLTPLFRRFERMDLDAGLLDPICKIVRSAQRRRYVEANDEYLTLSIGKAAWPIGVTMVGIHERSAREKLHESSDTKQAHILSDEQTRRYLQSIKRCLSFAQTRWPPDDLGQLMG